MLERSATQAFPGTCDDRVVPLRRGLERNVIVDCDAGVSLGNAARDPAVPVHATGCLVRNNFVTRAPEGGVFAAYVRDCKILHNTVCDPNGLHGRGVRATGEATGLVIVNNLLSGERVLVEVNQGVNVRGNCEGAPADQFTDLEAGDLRLVRATDGVTGAGGSEVDAGTDIDGQPRGERPDVGAHERGPD